MRWKNIEEKKLKQQFKKKIKKTIRILLAK